jgi:hypothetical protein
METRGTDPPMEQLYDREYENGVGTRVGLSDQYAGIWPLDLYPRIRRGVWTRESLRGFVGFTQVRNEDREYGGTHLVTSWTNPRSVSSSKSLTGVCVEYALRRASRIKLHCRTGRVARDMPA